MGAITVQAILDLAIQQEGYLEKASPQHEDSKTENAGTNNYTKYGRDLKNNIGSPYADGVSWCDEFCDWLFWKLGGKQAILDHLYGCSAYTPTSAQYFKNNGAWYTGTSPKPGYQIFFKNSQRICHTGIVLKCANGYVYTIEGNTTSAKGVVANGGCVRQKSYSVTYPAIAGYGIPKCAQGQTQSNASQALQEKKALVQEVKQVQTYVNENIMPFMLKQGVFQEALKVDGDYGKLSRHAILAHWKNEMNKQFNCGFDLKNSYFGPSCRANANKCVVSYGSTGTFALIAQLVLKSRGYYAGELDGEFGPQSCKAVVAFETMHHLIVESVQNVKVGQQVWYTLFN